MAPPTWKLSYHGYLWVVYYTSHLVLYCYHLVLKTCHPVLVKYQDSISRQGLKANSPVLNITNLTWSLPVKTVLNCRVCNNSVGQARHTYRQAINGNGQCGYTTDNPGTLYDKLALICMTHGLSADEISLYIRQVSLHNASFGIWHLTEYIWQCFKNRSLFFTIT